MDMATGGKAPTHTGPRHCGQSGKRHLIKTLGVLRRTKQLPGAKALIGDQKSKKAYISWPWQEAGENMGGLEGSRIYACKESRHQLQDADFA